MEPLKKIGLTIYEIQAYEALLKYGRLNAREIAGHSRVPITAVYPTVKKLCALQLVQEIKGEVRVFEAINPAYGIKKVIDNKKQELENTEEEIQKHLKNIPRQKQTEKKEIISLTYGRDISRTIYFDACKKTKKSYYVLGWKLNTISDKYTMLKEFKKLIKRGVDIRIIMTGDTNKNWQLIEDYKDEGIRLRYLAIKPDFSIFVIDARECKITLKNKSLPERHNIQVLDESLSRAMHEYFLEKWKQAREV